MGLYSGGLIRCSYGIGFTGYGKREVHFNLKTIFCSCDKYKHKHIGERLVRRTSRGAMCYHAIMYMVLDLPDYRPSDYRPGPRKYILYANDMKSLP